ncbi:MAG: alpha-1,2-fucosyltransferase [Lachnospiraceae bacterium]|nr:alpha-1,2-fucosyltransferase [Lachnospiraceae bacterium]
MLIVRLSTGLGNQMYEYMAAYALAKELRQELVLDIEECTRSAYGYLLDHFKIPACRKILYSQDSIGGGEYEFYDRTLEIFEDFVILVQSEEQKEVYKDECRVVLYSGWDMVDSLRDYKNIYMYGFFLQKNIYFEKYWSELKSLFILREENEDIRNFRELINGKTSVGIHIRRGDILLMDWFRKAEDDYYRAAIECCRELYGDCVFCVFSDDIEYARKMLGVDESVQYIHFYGYDDASVNEFICLSLCNHRILTAYSTFGQLADELHQGNDSHVFMWDVDETTKGKPLEKKSLNRMIFLNKEDIQKYSAGYKLVNEDVSKPIETLQYQRFQRLVEENRCHEALQSAFCLYHEKKADMEFKLYLAESLVRIGAYEEAVVELAMLPQDIAGNYLKKLILDDQKKNLLIRLHQAICNVNRKHFIIIMADIVTPAYETYGLLDLAIILAHLGHKATVVYDTCGTGDYYLQQSTYLHNTRDINMECFHVKKESVLKSGVCDFYNSFDEDELIVVSEDDRFFVRDDCSKKMCFIISDEQCESALLYNKVDYILTQDKKLAESDRKYVYWLDRGFQEKYVFVSIPWEYGYGQRLNRRMIGMAEALSKTCCK